MVCVPNATESLAIVVAKLRFPDPSNDPDTPVTSPVSVMVLPVCQAVAVDALPTKFPVASVMPAAANVECVAPSMVTVTVPVPESATTTEELPSVIDVDDIAPMELSTYALIDCCVASAVTESDDMLS